MGRNGQFVLALAAIAALVGTFVYREMRHRDTGDLELAPRTYAGVRVALPDGVAEVGPNRYENGKVTLASAGGLRGGIVLQWDLGEGLGADELAAMVGAFGDDLVEREHWTETVNGFELSCALFAGGDFHALLASFMCGNRNFLLVTVFEDGKDGQRALQRRILESFACENDPTAVARKAAPRFTPPTGYGYEPEGDDVQFLGLDGSAFAFFEGPAFDQDDEDKTVKALVAGMTSASGMQWTLGDAPTRYPVAAGGTRAIWSIRVTDEESGEMHGFLTLWSCPELALMFGGMFLAEHDEARDVAREALLAAECPRSGENPIDGYPTAAVVFAAACRAGDRRGCVE